MLKISQSTSKVLKKAQSIQNCAMKFTLKIAFLLKILKFYKNNGTIVLYNYFSSLIPLLS